MESSTISFLVFTCYFPLIIGFGSASAAAGTVILISFDGFRWDFIDSNRTDTRYFDSIINSGVKAEYVRNVFPTVTFPNHYSIVTGLYPESHGIIGNQMYDPLLRRSFTMRTTESIWWSAGEPVWVTNEKQRSKSGLCFWPGYDVKIGNYTAFYTSAGMGYGKPFVDHRNLMNWTARVDLVMTWLKTKDPPSFVALYFNSPDEAGHCCGPDSVNVTEAISETNNITGYLLKSLQEAGLLDQVNIIITADHGMAAYNTTTILHLDRYLSNYLIHSASYKIWSDFGAGFFLDAANVTETYNRLKKAEVATKKVKVYRKHEIPEDLHIKNNHRVPEILVVANEGWIPKLTPFDHAKHQNVVTHSKGSHGWLPSLPSMRPFFIAQGPAFKQGFKSGPIDMVDIYPLMCHILGIKPAPNNGSFSRISHLLRTSTDTSELNPRLNVGEIIALVIGSTIAITVCIYGFLMMFKDRRRSRRDLRPQEIDVPLMHDINDDEDVTM